MERKRVGGIYPELIGYKRGTLTTQRIESLNLEIEFVHPLWLHFDLLL